MTPNIIGSVADIVVVGSGCAGRRGSTWRDSRIGDELAVEVEVEQGVEWEYSTEPGSIHPPVLDGGARSRTRLACSEAWECGDGTFGDT